MSGFDQIPNWLRRRRGISGNAKIIWAYLRPLGPKRIPVGQRLIGEECGVDPKTVRRCLRELRASGLLHVEQVGQRRARYHTLSPNGDEGETPSHVRENLPGEPPPPSEGETPPPNGRFSPTVREKRPHPVREVLPHDHTPDINQTIPEEARARDRWEPPTHHSGVWRVFETACAEAGLAWPGMCSGLRNLDCQALLDRVGGASLVLDMRAWAAEVAERDAKPTSPWLSYSDHAGSWARRAKARAERSGRGRTIVPSAEETDRLIAEREQAYRADRARRRAPSEMTSMGGLLLQALEGVKP